MLSLVADILRLELLYQVNPFCGFVSVRDICPLRHNKDGPVIFGFQTLLLLLLTQGVIVFCAIIEPEAPPLRADSVTEPMVEQIRKIYTGLSVVLDNVKMFVSELLLVLSLLGDSRHYKSNIAVYECPVRDKISVEKILPTDAPVPSGTECVNCSIG